MMSAKRPMRYLWKIFALFCLLWLVFYCYQKFLQGLEKAGTDITSTDGVDSLEKVRLGETEQWLLIRSRDLSNPVLLFLHGGPGSPLFTYARDIGVRAGLEEFFTVVYWEQRGTGKSYSPSLPDESMTLERFILDAHELLLYLRDRFETDKIYLMARSWGSLFGIYLVQRYPELIGVYIGIGQVIEPMASDSISYEYALEYAARSGRETALNSLREIGPPPYFYKKLLAQRKWLTQFHESLLSATFGTDKPNHRLALLSTPEYSLFDVLKMGLDPFFSIRNLWTAELYNIDIAEEIIRLEVPVYFLAGRFDYFSSSTLVYEYFDKLEAPRGKHFYWFERSGHKPAREEPDRFHTIMAEEVIGAEDALSRARQ